MCVVLSALWEALRFAGDFIAVFNIACVLYTDWHIDCQSAGAVVNYSMQADVDHFVADAIEDVRDKNFNHAAIKKDYNTYVLIR